MGQPEMQPEGPPQDGRGGEGAAGPRPGDLTGREFPSGDWGEPAERLEELYRWVEHGALQTVTWYLAGRVWKRRGARVLRAGAAGGAVVGAALPLLDLTGTLAGAAAWGYLALVVAVACAGVDRGFGVTSGWMRDVATAQAVQRRLQLLQFEWASENVREVLGPTDGTAGEAADRCLGVLRRFSEDVAELVRVETADWMVEFRTGGAGGAPLGMQGVGVGVGFGLGLGLGVRDAGTGVGRAAGPPSGPARPNMPRQRPPEAR
ncbi:SLATT domain-containing protein [Streptomyces sp. NPDC004610]|uniref:SLATT domain-containing protein n=1 Tax=unclassified Streptomyces TaxID=2593676 RepID=UPI0033AEB17F